MVTPGSKFTRKKEEAIAALLTQRNVEEAARAAGVGTQTLLRWLKVPEFQAAYREARRAGLDPRAGCRQCSGSRQASHRDRRHRGSRGGAGSNDSDRIAAKMKTIDGRTRKLEDRFWPGNAKPTLLLVMTKAGWGWP